MRTYPPKVTLPSRVTLAYLGYPVQPYVTKSLCRHLYQLISTGSILSILAYPQYSYHSVCHTGLSLVHCSYLSVGSLQKTRCLLLFNGTRQVLYAMYCGGGGGIMSYDSVLKESIQLQKGVFYLFNIMFELWTSSGMMFVWTLV